MPNRKTTTHTPALAASLDMSRYAGSHVLTLDGVPVSMPAAAGLYWDAPALCHGYGSRALQTAGEQLTSEWAAQGQAGSISMAIGEDDRITVASSVTPVAIHASADNASLGFPAGGVGAFGLSHTAGGDWERGLVRWTDGIRLKTDAGVVVSLPHGEAMATIQSIPTWLRPRGGAGDPDDVWLGLTLEDLLQDVPGQETARCYVTASGRIAIDYLFGGAGLSVADLSWWRSLGGSGREAPTESGARRVLTTEYPCPAFVAPKYGTASLRRVSRIRSTRHEMADGSVSSTGLPPVHGWEMTLRVQGPAHGAADLEATLRRFWDLAEGPLTYYPQWGSRRAQGGSMDPRRHIDPDQCLELYSDHHSSEGSSPHGLRRGGRLLVALDQGDERSRVESYPGELDVWQEVRLRVLDDPTR